MTNVWILADDRAGNVNQLLGIAEALGEPFERIDIRYDRWIKLPNLVRGKSLIGLDAESRNKIKGPWPDVVLSAGRRSFPVARYIRKQSGNRTRIVQLMNPGCAGFKEASLVVLPAHDGYQGKSKNVLVVTGTPHRVSRARLIQERQKWEPVFRDYPHRRLSLIVGGATKNNPFTIEMAHDLVAGVQALKPASILVTTSRRTPNEVVQTLANTLPQPFFFYRFGDKTENPYFGLLACADEIVVTGDSMSMCSECCATGVPVHIFAPDQMMSPKHKRFHQTLYREGYAVPLGQEGIAPKGTLNPAFEIAEKIKEMNRDDG
ncbi:MAG: mitochondrial fission ELM1 family protein [Alphaproteobacteria bacterium]|nr:mitochondrial fission ELM1 family protein [Alphaproteobacteria bacterium]